MCIRDRFITAFSLIISSALFFLDIRLPFAFNAIFFCVALVATKNLKDNKQLHNIKSVQGKKNNFSLESIYQIINHTNIYFLFADVLFVSTTIFMFETYQPQMTESNIPVSYTHLQKFTGHGHQPPQSFSGKTSPLLSIHRSRR